MDVVCLTIHPLTDLGCFHFRANMNTVYTYSCVCFCVNINLFHISRINALELGWWGFWEPHSYNVCVILFFCILARIWCWHLILAILRERWFFIVVSMCIFLMAKNIWICFPYLPSIYHFQWNVYLCLFLFSNWISFLKTVLRILYCGYKSFFRYVASKWFLEIYSLSFHVQHLPQGEVLILTKSNLTNFLVVDCTFVCQA